MTHTPPVAAQGDAAEHGDSLRGTARDAAQRDPWQRWGWLIAVVWLVFLYFPITALVQSEAALGWRVLAWVSIAGFATAYVVGMIVGMRYQERRPIHPVVLSCFLAAVVFALLTVPALDSYALGLAPFVMSYAAFGLGGWWHWATSGGCLALGGIVLLREPGQVGAIVIFVIIAIMIVILSVMTWLIQKSIESEQINIQLATSQEREAIARDVHDLIGHSLTVVRLKAELAQKLIDVDPARARAELAEITALAAEAIAGVRSTVTGLRASTLDEQLRLSTEVLRDAGVYTEVRGATSALSAAQSITASWILREATTNILRHAGAGAVTMRFAPGTMVIEDDGRGVAGDAGNGLRGMAERASASGARLSIDAATPRGTRVEVVW